MGKKRHPYFFKLEELKRYYGYSRRQFCKLLGLPYGTYLSYSTGKRNPSRMVQLLVDLIEQDPDGMMYMLHTARRARIEREKRERMERDGIDSEETRDGGNAEPDGVHKVRLN